jgi:hypothetical protein
MPRAPKSPLSSIIAYAMNAPIAEVQQAAETIKTIVKQRQEQGLKEPALPLKVAKRKPRARKPAQQISGTTTLVDPVAPAGPPQGRAQTEAAARSPRRRPPVTTPAPVATAAAATPLGNSNGFPDQAVDPGHVE